MAMTNDKNAALRQGAESVAPLARRLLWVDTAAGVNRLIVVLVCVCAVLFFFDFLWHRHSKVPGEDLRGYHAIVGFVAFSLIVIGARLLRLIIRRGEDFYGDNGVDNELYPAADTARLPHAEYRPDSLRDFAQQLRGGETSGNEVQSCDGANS